MSLIVFDDVMTAESAVSDADFRDILAATRHFVRAVIVPRESEIAEGDRIPDDIRNQAKAMGLFGYAIPQEWCGLGLVGAKDVELALESGYTALAVRSMFGTNNGIAGQVLVGFGTEDQKARWLEPMASGEVVASFALTEPGAGSNPPGLRIAAVRSGDGWVSSGQKRWITNAPMADLRRTELRRCRLRCGRRWGVRGAGTPMLRIASSDNGQTPARSGSASAISPHAECGAAGNSVGGRSRAPEAARPQGGRATAFGRTSTELPAAGRPEAGGLVICVMCAENVRESIADGIATGWWAGWGLSTLVFAENCRDDFGCGLLGRVLFPHSLFSARSETWRRPSAPHCCRETRRAGGGSAAKSAVHIF
jgi:hypothetical protein